MEADKHRGEGGGQDAKGKNNKTPRAALTSGKKQNLKVNNQHAAVSLWASSKN